MIKNWKVLVASVLLSLSMFGAGAAFTSAANAQTIAAARSEYGSARNLLRVKGAVPGAQSGVVVVRSSVKAKAKI